MSQAPRKVVVVDSGYDSYAREQSILAPLGATVVLRPCHGDAAKVAQAVVDADAVLVRESPVSAEAIGGMRHCQAIVRYGIGVDNINLDAARARRIAVANVPDYGTEEVSDQALALMLAVARRIVSRHLEVQAGEWNIGPAQKMYRLAGKTAGLIGFGRIGAAFARKVKGIGMGRVLAYDPWAALPPGVEAADVDRICRESDVIALHAPLTPETRGILSRERIALMKPSAIVVNTARGPLIDEGALVAALREQRLFGAGLDVFGVEPIRPDNPLLGLPNVVVSDHTGWYSEEAVQDLQGKAAQEVARVLRGEPPLHWLNRWQA